MQLLGLEVRIQQDSHKLIYSSSLEVDNQEQWLQYCTFSEQSEWPCSMSSMLCLCVLSTYILIMI